MPAPLLVSSTMAQSLIGISDDQLLPGGPGPMADRYRDEVKFKLTNKDPRKFAKKGSFVERPPFNGSVESRFDQYTVEKPERAPF